MKAQIKTALLLLAPALSLAQVPVDDDGNAIGTYQTQADVMQITDDGIPLLSNAQLQELVGPIALYPDDLLAIVLPAAAYPLQIVEAARFLEALETDSSLKPDPNWDDSIVALINYPEVVELMNDDLDWTLRLGEAVVAQQTDVVAAVEAFRDRAYAAGNLESDAYQTVSREDDIIRIAPVSEEVIYVPYYEPAQVVYYQPRPVYYYHPQPYPVYYYPYSAGHHFDHGYFWGVTTAFTIGWLSDSLHVYHHSYHGHPYYGRTYWNDGWYRRPSINVYNTTYVNNRNVNVNRHSRGDQWHARDTRREYVRREGYSRATARADRNEVSNERQQNVRQRDTRQRDSISFRERDQQSATRARETQARNSDRQTRRIDRLENTRETTPDSRREQPTFVARNTTQRREQSADRSRDNMAQYRSRRSGETTTTARAPARTERPAARSERAPTRTERPAARTQRETTRTEQPAARTQRSPTRTERPAARTERAPNRSQPVQREQPHRSEPRRQAEPTRSRETSSSSSPRSQPAAPSSQRSEKRSSRSRDRKER